MCFALLHLSLRRSVNLLFHQATTRSAQNHKLTLVLLSRAPAALGRGRGQPHNNSYVVGALRPGLNSLPGPEPVSTASYFSFLCRRVEQRLPDEATSESTLPKSTTRHESREQNMPQRTTGAQINNPAATS